MAIGAAVGVASQLDAIIGPYGVASAPTIVIAGSVVGGVAGMKLEEAMNSERLVQIHVLLDNGKEVVVTQKATKGEYKVHGREKVSTYGNSKKQVFRKDHYVERENNPYVLDQSGSRGTK